VWRQNVGTLPAYDDRGKVRYVKFGPPAGAGDISGILLPSGRRIEIEVKVRGRKRTKAQVAWAQFILAAGGVYCHVDQRDEPIDAAVRRCVAEVASAVAKAPALGVARD
jgi:hypothetical protein